MKVFVALLCFALVATSWAEEPETRGWLSNLQDQLQNAANNFIDNLYNIASIAGAKTKESLEKVSQLIKDLETRLDAALAQAASAANEAQKTAYEKLAKELQSQINKLKELKEKLEQQLNA